MASSKVIVAFLIVFVLVFVAKTDAGVIKDLFKKITHTNNKTEDVVKQSAPICGSGIFSTPDELSLSPEIIFISGKPSRSERVVEEDNQRDNQGQQRRRGNENDKNKKPENVNEVAYEYRFNVDNVTLEDLERNGFNRDAPVTFLMHGFTSGYPLQAWISAIVEAYTIDRETTGQAHQGGYQNNNHEGGYQDHDHHQDNYQHQSGHNNNNYNNQREEYRENTGSRREQNNGNRNRDRGGSSSKKVNHNLFIINWNYAARGVLYPRAVANIPIVASYATRFINDKLLDEAQVDPRRIQLIGHSLGAHLAGFIGKNTKRKVGRIYGLDPAGPCFGAISGPLYPSSNRLAPTDAEEVITIQTNTVLLGIDKPLGKHSVFVEGGEVQPGCKGGGVLKSLSTLTWDGGDLDTIACSHSRAPNLMTYRHDQSDSQDDCQLVAYECKDWESFVAGHCGVCEPINELHSHSSQRDFGKSDPLQPVECIRIGLDWQYPKAGQNSQSSSNSYEYSSTTSRYDRESDNNQYGRYSTTPAYSRNPYNSSHESLYGYSSTTSNYDRDNGKYPYEGYIPSTTRRPYDGYSSSTSRRPYSQGGQNQGGYQQSSSNNDRYNSRNTSTYNPGHDNNDNQGSSWNRKPVSNQRDRRDTQNSTSNKEQQESTRRRQDDSSSSSAKSMFLRTGDTQPYCVYQYQIVLELNEPFPNLKKPPMSLVLQDSEAENERKQTGGSSSASSSSGSPRRGAEQNSLSDDEFGNKYTDRMYTKLLTSGKKLKKVDHATLLFRNGLSDGHKILKSLHVNYMSHSDPKVRRQFSSRLCLVKTDVDRHRERDEKNFGGNRYYFEPCERGTFSQNGSQSNYGREDSYSRGRSTTRGPSSYDN